MEDEKIARDSEWKDVLRHKIKVLASTAWKDRWGNESDTLTPWLSNFNEEDQTKALYLLSRFLYYDADCIKELLRRSYEDYVRRPIIHNIRKEKNDTMDESIIEFEYKHKLSKIRFLCLGNPSESSAMLLYYFRQINRLPVDLFISIDRLYVTTDVDESLKVRTSLEGIERIIVLDDFCATGSQAEEFNNHHVNYIKQLTPHVKIEYLAIVGTERGQKKLMSLSYDNYCFVSYLDESFKVFSKQSRFFEERQEYVCPQDEYILMCKKYGRRLDAQNPLGFKKSALMIGFHHNTPNNTLPIFWSENRNWNPIFKRYKKIY